MRRLLDAFEVPATRIPATTEAQAGLYRTILANRQALIILDNARDADQVRPLLPGNPACCVLITSRNQLAGLVAAEGAVLLQLEPLPEDDAVSLLAARLNARRVEAEPQAVADIISSCGQLPLALNIVAAQAATQPQAPLRHIAEALRRSARPLDAFDVGDATTDVRRVFSWSYRCLSSASARMFGLLALHPGPDAALAAIASLAGQPPHEVSVQLTELVRQHLVIVTASGRYTFHDLVRSYALEMAETSSERESAVQRVLSHYTHSASHAAILSYPTRDPLPLAQRVSGVVLASIGDKAQAMAWISAEYQTLLAAVRFSAGNEFASVATALSWALEHHFDSRGLWRDWREITSLALDAAERTADTLGEALAHRGLSRAASRVANYVEADFHCHQAERLFAELNDLVGLAHAHVSHGYVAERLGRLEETLAHTEKALALFRAAGHLVGEGRALNNLGWHHALRGEYDLALGYCQEAVALQRKTGNRTSEANAWDSLGYVHLQRGALADAITCYSHALTLHHEDGNLADQADTWEAIGEAHLADGDTANAIAALSTALAIQRAFNPEAAARLHLRVSQLRKVDGFVRSTVGDRHW